LTGAFLCVFAGVFEGGFGKNVFFGWCFRGEIVADLWWFVVSWGLFFCAEKRATVLNFIFLCTSLCHDFGELTMARAGTGLKS
jgi:hypothetical protein